MFLEGISQLSIMVWPTNSANVKTNVSKILMALVEKHYCGHQLYQRNNTKLSYSFISNKSNVIRKHYSEIMKMHHHLPLNLVTTVRNPTVLWMVTIFVSKLFTKYLLIQLPTNIITALLKILFKNVIKTIIMFFTKNQFLMIWNLY